MISLTLQKLEIGGYIVPVELHDKKIYNFLLDTGATHTVIFRNKIGFGIPGSWYSDEKVEAMTHFGLKQLDIIKNILLIIGGEKTIVPSVAVNHATYDLDIAGVIGLDALQQLNALIVFDNKGCRMNIYKQP